jgi:hypothetical protein
METSIVLATVQVANATGTFFKSLLNEGFNREEAFALTASFLTESLKSAVTSAAEKNC